MRSIRAWFPKYLFLLLILSPVFAGAPAHADVWPPSGNGYTPSYDTCGPYCMANGGGQMRVFGGTGYGYGGYGYQTGQMSGGQMDMNMVMVSNALNWNGAQPMGLSYMPALGLGAVANREIWSQAYGGMSGGAY